MKTNNQFPELDLAQFYGFVKSSKDEKIRQLLNKGILMDTDIEKDTKISLYYLEGFFVELSTSVKSKQITDIVPFKRGYRVQNYLQLKQVFVPIATESCFYRLNEGALHNPGKTGFSSFRLQLA